MADMSYEGFRNVTARARQQCLGTPPRLHSARSTPLMLRTLTAQMIDLTVTLSRPAGSIEDLLAPLREAASGRLNGVLCVIDQELVSSDFLGFPQSTIIDAPATIMLSPTVFKVSSRAILDWLPVVHGGLQPLSKKVTVAG